MCFMQTLSKIDQSAYREGNSWLHRFDPRLKLVLLLGLIGCLFAASGPWRLLLLAGLWIALASFCPDAWRDSLRVLMRVRWLLLFSLLLHLCFTPGRTLFGTSWLSYDGLLRGLQVDSQLLLAILFSLLLAWTTRPAELAWGLTRLLTPLQRFRVPVAEAGGLLLLVLHFFPFIQKEVTELKQAQPTGNGSWWSRLQKMVALLKPLLFRLVERADQLALDIVAGKSPLPDTEYARDGRIAPSDLAGLLLGVAVLLLLWMV